MFANTDKGSFELDWITIVDSLKVILLSCGEKIIRTSPRWILKGHSQLFGRAEKDTSFLTLKKVRLNQKSKSSRVHHEIRFNPLNFWSLLEKSVFECTVSHRIILFFSHLVKTLWIASPEEHEKERWKTWRFRAEEIPCFRKNNERNKSEAMEGKSSLYIFRKSRFFDQAKCPCGCSVWSSDEDEKSEYQLFHIFRPVFDFHTGKKCSEYLDLFCRMNNMKLSRTMAYKTRKTVDRLERKQLHFLMWCQNDHGWNKPTHRAREA